MRTLFYRLAALSCLVVMSASCVMNSAPPRRADRVLYQWHDDGGEGKVCIKISLPDQIAEFRRGDRKIGWSYVATGKEGHDTTAGTYRIMEKIEDKHSNRYGWIEDEFGNVVDGDAQPGDRVPEGMMYVAAPMPFWMRLTSYGIGMHGGLIPEPGKPASHGCIRLPKEFAPVLYENVDVGTPVTITNERSSITPDLLEPAPPQHFVGESRVIATRPLTPADLHPPGPPRAPRRYTDPFSAY